MELYKKYRPTTFDEVVGQKALCRTLTEMGKSNSIPHTLLLHGPSGNGKTTIARILAAKMRCDGPDLVEVNAASTKGIDMVRDIQSAVHLNPLRGNCRIWIIDEAHQLTTAAQDAFLKTLEDTPAHAYFILCTTDPGKLKATIKTRCTALAIKPLDDAMLTKVLKNIQDQVRIILPDEVFASILEHADGSARKAVVLYEAATKVPAGKNRTAEMLEIVAADGDSPEAIELARAVCTGKQWQTVAPILKNLKEVEPETLRRIVLGYANAMLLNGNKNAAHVLECFEEPFYNTGRPGLTLACWRAVT